MAIGSGNVSLSDIVTEFNRHYQGGAADLLSYVKNGSYVSTSDYNVSNIPTSAPIDLLQFRNACQRVWGINAHLYDTGPIDQPWSITVDIYFQTPGATGGWPGYTHGSWSASGDGSLNAVYSDHLNITVSADEFSMGEVVCSRSVTDFYGNMDYQYVTCTLDNF